MMTIAQIMEKMIAFSEGNIHDITHLSCVWTYAKTIGELEGVDAETQFILEVAAITHDIACPHLEQKPHLCLLRSCSLWNYEPDSSTVFLRLLRPKHKHDLHLSILFLCGPPRGLTLPGRCPVKACPAAFLTRP